MRNTLRWTALLAAAMTLSCDKIKVWGGPLQGAYFVLEDSARVAKGAAEDVAGGFPRTTFEEKVRVGGAARAGATVSESRVEFKPYPYHAIMDLSCNAEAGAKPNGLQSKHAATEAFADGSHTIILPETARWQIRVVVDYNADAYSANAGAAYGWHAKLSEKNSGTALADWRNVKDSIIDSPADDRRYANSESHADTVTLQRGLRYVLECHAGATAWADRKPRAADPGVTFPLGGGRSSVWLTLMKLP